MLGLYETWESALGLGLSALAAGVVNSLAGGGTLLTFPALLTILPPVSANATSTVALMPGSLASAWGFRQEMRRVRRWALVLIPPSLLGGILGSLLMTRLDPHYFDVLVPWLILIAALLLLAQPFVARWLGSQPHGPPSRRTLASIVFFQFLVSIYGGYFGAGIGILMLSALGLMGLANIHEMNALKNLLAVCINGVSVLVFVLSGKVQWSSAAVMTVAAILGGYLGARTARRLRPSLVRGVVIVLGFSLAAYFFYRQYAAHMPPRDARTVSTRLDDGGRMSIIARE